MGDPLTLSRALHWLLLTVIALTILSAKALPLDIGQHNWPGPQLFLAFAAAWVVRRPDFVPIGLLALIALSADLLQSRPPGLWAALTIVFVEFLRIRSAVSREWPFSVEWGIFGGMVMFMLLANRLILGIFAVPQPRFGLEMQQYISTFASFPVAVAITVYVFGIRHIGTRPPGVST